MVRVLAQVGANVRLARLRRRFSVTLVAERAGMSRATLRAVERGDKGVSLGALANVLHCLALEKDLAGLARDDELGRTLQDSALTHPRKKKR